MMFFILIGVYIHHFRFGELEKKTVFLLNFSRIFLSLKPHKYLSRVGIAQQIAFIYNLIHLKINKKMRIKRISLF
jgi:hypothetical protein